MSVDKYFELSKKGYETIAFASRKDDCYDAIEEFSEDSIYIHFAVTRYKRKPGQEDSYAVLALPKYEYEYRKICENEKYDFD